MTRPVVICPDYSPVQPFRLRPNANVAPIAMGSSMAQGRSPIATQQQTSGHRAPARANDAARFVLVRNSASVMISAFTRRRRSLLMYDVLIVGYGPTGMLAATLHGRAGHRVGVFERHKSLYNLARVGIVHDDIL